MKRNAGKTLDQRNSAKTGTSVVPWAIAVVAAALVAIAMSHLGLTLPYDSWFSRVFHDRLGESDRTWHATEQGSTGIQPDSENFSLTAGKVSHETSHLNSFAGDSGDSLSAGAGTRTDAAPPESIDSEQSGYVDDSIVGEDPGDDQANDEPRTFSISGWVRTETGQPVAGIGVSGLLKRPFTTQQSNSFVPAQGRLTTGTDANGAFGFGPLVEGEYEVSTIPDGYYDAVARMVRAGTDSLIIVVSESGNREVYLYGVVSSTDGNLLPGVRIAPAGVKTSESYYTDAAGNYAMYLPVQNDGRTYTVRFTHEGYRERLLPLQIEEASEITSFQLDAQLEPLRELATVTGTVTSAEGASVHGAVIEMLSPSIRRSHRAVSDRTGHFVLPDVEVAGDYRLWARSEGYQDYLQEGLTVNRVGSRFMVTLELLNDGRLTGRMADSQGKPIPNFTLWVRSSHTSAVQARQVTGDETGMFTIDNLPEGSISLSSLSSPYMSISGIELAAGASKEVQITLDTGQYQTSGQVLDTLGEPVPGAQATLVWSHEGNGIQSRSSRDTVADASGQFRFSRLGPGAHTLIVQAPGFRSARIDYGVAPNSASIPITLAER